MEPVMNGNDNVAGALGLLGIIMILSGVAHGMYVNNAPIYAYLLVFGVLVFVIACLAVER
jgi:hydrogenase/urease accessory protein HupE